MTVGQHSVSRDRLAQRINIFSSTADQPALCLTAQHRQSLLQTARHQFWMVWEFWSFLVLCSRECLFVIQPYFMHAIASKLLMTACSVVRIRLSCHLWAVKASGFAGFLIRTECVSYQGTVYTAAMRVVGSEYNATLL